MWICGKILQCAQPFNGFARGPHINIDEADEFYTSLINTPVYLDHRYDESVGEVVEIFTGPPEGDIYAVLMLDKTKQKAWDVIREISKGAMCGLSVGQIASYDYETGVRCGKSRGIEISIVQEGAIPNSRIVCYGDGNKTFISQSGISRVFKIDFAARAHNNNNKMEELEKSIKEAKAAISTVAQISQNPEEQVKKISAERLAELEAKAKEWEKMNEGKRFKMESGTTAATMYLQKMSEEPNYIKHLGDEANKTSNILSQQTLILAAGLLVKEQEKHLAAFNNLESKFNTFVNTYKANKQPPSVLEVSRTGDSSQTYADINANFDKNIQIDHEKIKQMAKDLASDPGFNIIS